MRLLKRPTKLLFGCSRNVRHRLLLPSCTSRAYTVSTLFVRTRELACSSKRPRHRPTQRHPPTPFTHLQESRPTRSHDGRSLQTERYNCQDACYAVPKAPQCVRPRGFLVLASATTGRGSGGMRRGTAADIQSPALVPRTEFTNRDQVQSETSRERR